VQIWAATVVLAQGDALLTVPVEIRFDARAPATICQLDAESKAHPLAGAVAATLWSIVGQTREVAFGHVFAHSAVIFKELADSICRVGASLPHLCWGGAHPARHCAALAIEETRLIHVVATPPHLSDAYPMGASERVLRSGTEGGFWRALTSRSFAAPFDDRPGLEDAFIEASDSHCCSSVGAEVLVASFNTLSMRQAGAYSSCALQMEHFGIAFPGLQEARPREAASRPCLASMAASLWPLALRLLGRTWMPTLDQVTGLMAKRHHPAPYTCGRFMHR
jgi:hypothetical protein